MSEIFVSYGRTDESFVQQLVKRLKSAGANVWIDTADIRSGEDWSDAIQQALDRCSAMILVISPDSMESANVANEWKYHLDDNKPVIPVLYKPARVHFQLRRLQYVNFHTQDFETAFAQLHSELRRKGIHLSPLDPEDSSVLIPVQAPLPSYDDSHIEPAGSRSSIPAGQGSFYAGQSSQGGYAGTPSYAAPGYYSQPAAQPGVSNLLDYGVNLFRSRNWQVKGFSGDSAWFEGWSFGSKDKKVWMYILMIVAPLIFSLLGGLAAWFIASQSYKRYNVTLKREPDGRVSMQGDLGQYTISKPEEMMTVAHYVDIDKTSMNGSIVWVLPLVTTIIGACCWFSIYSSSLSSSGYYY